MALSKKWNEKQREQQRLRRAKMSKEVALRDARKHQEWCSKNRERINRYQRTRYANDVEGYRYYNKMLRQQPKHQNTMKIARERWAKNHPEKTKENAIKQRVKRQARIYSTAPVLRFTAQDWMEIVANYDGKCAYCGGIKKLERDHITPIAKGGHHTKDNIRPSCRSCNAKKGTGHLTVTINRTWENDYARLAI